jgi:hypothetical protein
MNFRTKDLMISVVPKEALNPNLDILCRYPTKILCWRQCSFLPTCWGCSYQITEIPTLCRLGTIDLGPINCTGTIRCAGSMTPWEGPQTIEDIGALREQLKAQLVQLDEAEAGLKEGPTTLAEADTLEAHLKEALSQVQARKAEIKGAKK